MNELARTYEKVFAGEPWNEYKKCSGLDCGESFGLEAQGKDICPCPNEAMLTPFYPRTETLAAITHETDRPGAVLETKRSVQGEIIGFVWGYPTTLSEFLYEKYKTDEGRSAVRDALVTSGVTDKFFYFSETGVVSRYRGQGMSNEFAQVMVTAAQKINAPMVMRTNWQSPMVAVAKRFTMQQVLGSETLIESGRMYQTGRIINSLDTENGNRVLYVRPSIPNV